MVTMLTATGNTDNDRLGLIEAAESQQQQQDDHGQMQGSGCPGPDASNSRRTLSTFYGVVAPVCLSMFSTLLFLRIGYIVGNAGLLLALLLLAIAYLILFITVSSIAAISTNGEIEGGGVYYMISRTLGPDFGASVGLLFWLANLVGSALFCTGCAEGLADAAYSFFGFSLPFESEYLSGITWSTLLNLVNLIVSLVGGPLFGRLVVIFLCLVMTAYAFVLVSFCSEYEVQAVYNETAANCSSPANCTYTVSTGHFSGLLNANLSFYELAANVSWPTFERDCEDPAVGVNIASVFAVLFSGVTGIMAGANLSGELKRPSHAIPRGTITACTITFVCYALFFILTGLTCDRALLYHDCQYMQVFNEYSPVVVSLGIFFTTFCASLSCLLGGSRILESVCKDLLVGPFKAIYNANRWNNPIGSVVLSWLVVQACLLLGSLNRISKLCSVLYLLAYAAVNLACFVLDWASPPNFRPTSSVYHWSTSLVGVIVCLAVSLVIHPVFALVSWVLCVIIYVSFLWVEPATERNWGSITQAVMFHQVRKYLLYLDPRKSHVKYWRPQVLLLVSSPRRSCGIIEFTNALKKGGLFVLGHVLKPEASGEDPTLSAHGHWLSLVDHLGIKAFIELTVSASLREGVQHLIRLSGLGAMKPNTVVLGLPFPDEEVRDDFVVNTKYRSDELDAKFPAVARRADFDADEYMQMLHDAYALKKNICLFRHFQKLDHGDWFEPGLLGLRTVRRKPMVFFDVWLADFFAPPNANFSDTCSEFILQLAVIVNMVKQWKKLTVRAMLRVADRHTPEAADLEQNLRLLLERVRIPATVMLVEFAPPEGVVAPTVTADGTYELSEISDAHFDYVNRRIVQLSNSTAIAFFYLRRPPFCADSARKRRFLELIQILSKEAPPTLFIHGVDNVISTSI